MKYWVFQNNQVIGPYAPEDLGRLVSFTPESLVCPEGRKGTSMGDWQRAGMVPDLSVALVRSSQRQPARAGLATLAGLPPEPTLKDLAVLGGLQEKVAMLEDVAAQLQESLRLKEAELSSVHGALSDKDREVGEFRQAAEKQKRESEELRRQLAGLEERIGAVNSLSDTLDKAVEAERQVEGDVLKQGETIAALSRELEELRRRLEERLASPPPAPAPQPAASLAPLDLPSAAPATPELPPTTPATPELPPAGLQTFDLPSAALPAAPAAAFVPVAQPAAAEPAFEIEMPALPPEPAPAPAPAPAAVAPSLDPILSSEPFTPLASAGVPSLSDRASLAPDAASAPAADLLAPEEVAKPKKGRAALVGVGLGVLAVGAGAFYMGLIPGMGPTAPMPVVEAPAPEPAPEPVAPPPPAPDPRQDAVALAKSWPLAGGQTLGGKLDSVAPASGSLSPWMAEALPDGRVQVNYFASGAAAGSPTIAYEFVADLASKTLSGRNAAAKSILAGKAPAPPKPAAARPVRVKPKAKPAPADDESLDALLAGDDAAPRPSQASAAVPDPKTPAPADSADAEVEALLEPGAAAPKPAKGRERPSRRSRKTAEEKASDEALLDDLLRE